MAYRAVCEESPTNVGLFRTTKSSSSDSIFNSASLFLVLRTLVLPDQISRTSRTDGMYVQSVKARASEALYLVTLSVCTTVSIFPGTLGSQFWWGLRLCFGCCRLAPTLESLSRWQTNSTVYHPYPPSPQCQSMSLTLSPSHPSSVLLLLSVLSGSPPGASH